MILGCSALALTVYQHVALIRYQMSPPNVNCDKMINRLGDNNLKNLAYMEWLETSGGSLYDQSLKFDQNVSKLGAYVCFCNHEIN